MALPDLRLDGKVAVITGGGSGIGQGIALLLAEAGAQVAVAGRTKQRLGETCLDIQKAGGTAIAVPTDVQDSRQADALINQVAQAFGHIDILVNSAGIRYLGTTVPLPRQPQPPDVNPGSSPRMSDEDWTKTLDVNVSGTFYCCRAVAPLMIKQGGGSIINISSTAAFKVAPFNPGYHTSKSAVSMLTRALAVEWGPYNIRVNAIAPGFVLTDMIREQLTDENFMRRALRLSPLGRLGTPQDMAMMTLYLAGSSMSFMTGQTVCLDGGLSAW